MNVLISTQAPPKHLAQGIPCPLQVKLGWLVAVMLLLISQIAMAEELPICQTYRGQPKTITLNVDKTNKIRSSADLNGDIINPINLPFQIPLPCRLDNGPLTVSYKLDSGHNSDQQPIATNLAGIGYRIWLGKKGSSLFKPFTLSASVINDTLVIPFVRMSPVLSAGLGTVQETLTLTADQNPTYPLAKINLRLSYHFYMPSCSVRVPSVVDLGRHTLSEFHGQGSASSRAKPFTATVDCLGAGGYQHPQYYIEAVPNNNSLSDNGLGLIHTTSPGLSVQLADQTGANAIKLGENNRYLLPHYDIWKGNKIPLNFNARLYQSGPKIATGAFTANAKLVIVYDGY